MKLFFAILMGKFILFLSRILRIGGGSAAPGFYGLKIEANLVEKLSKDISKNIIITGTNGKTTTARMLAHFAKKNGLKVIRNYTGSNLERGIASTLISSVHLPGVRLTYDLGIWELDEAAFNIVAPKINPDIVVFLNIFRDQLDRYGEVDTVLKRWCETLKNLDKQTVVIVNGDDTHTANLKSCFAGKVIRFGVEGYKILGEAVEKSSSHQKLEFEATKVKLNGLYGTTFQLKTNSKGLTTNLPIPGIYHVYDFMAAFAAGKSVGFEEKSMIFSLKDYSPAFGRVEKFIFPPRGSNQLSTPGVGFGFIFLIKNPAGATQVFETLAPEIKKEDVILTALNDNLADGTDVSWIWDADFEKLEIRNLKLEIILSGTRAYDLAVRLKYAGINQQWIIVEPDLNRAFKKSISDIKGRLFILPTYTAMLNLQKILAKSGIKRHYWEED